MEIAETISSIFIVLGFVAGFVLSFVFYTRVKHQEKMAMIEKGYQPPARQPREKRKRSQLSLKGGVFIISISVGLFVGYLLASSTSVNEVVSFFSMIMLFGGAGLVINHYLEGKSKEVQN